MGGEAPYLREIRLSGKCELWNPFWERTVSEILDCIEHRNQKRIYDRHRMRTMFIIFYTEDEIDQTLTW